MTLFENDSSSARPSGSMEVRRLYWWKHNCKSGQYSSAEVHRSLEIHLKDDKAQPMKFEDYDVILKELDGLRPEVEDKNCR